MRAAPAKALPPKISHITSVGPVAGISPVLPYATFPVVSVIFAEEVGFFIDVGVGVKVGEEGVGEILAVVMLVLGRNLPSLVRRLVAILLLDKSTIATKIKPKKIRISLLADIFCKFGL